MSTDPFLFTIEQAPTKPAAPKKAPKPKPSDHHPDLLGKAAKLTVPDFSDPNRPLTCLEVDFPIAPVNALSNLEGNAGKPVYQMSKWWARRRSSVFRSLLIAAATEAPDDPEEAAKLVWDHYYANHQKAGSFKGLRVLEPFMGGGTTLVEGSRLGFELTGVDLNPVAWFVVKNELAGSDPEQVRALFDHVEAQVKPQVQPFYTTTCPRGHQGRWIDTRTDAPADQDPLHLAPANRAPYRWDGPEVIYTFWAKHGQCVADGCDHRTPTFKTPVMAEKTLTAYYVPVACPHCGTGFRAELGETRMAPGAERVVLDSEGDFTEIRQETAQLLSDYSKGNKKAKFERVHRLLQLVPDEPGLHCPSCDEYAGQTVEQTLRTHAKADRVGDVNKKDFGIKRVRVPMTLLVHPDWLAGASAVEDGAELGGYAGADPDATARWWQTRLDGLRLIEVRGSATLSDSGEVLDEGDIEDLDDEETEATTSGLPPTLMLADGSTVDISDGTVPARSAVACQACGREQDLLDATRSSGHTAPVASYGIQCHCPQCEAEGYNYNGRYFKALDAHDLDRLVTAETEWAERSEGDLKGFWPEGPLQHSYMTHHLNGGIPNWGYTHWWKMFNPRQLLVHSQLAKTITEAGTDWPLDVVEQALGAFQQYLRNQNMFAFWDISRDCLAPMMSNANYHPKQIVTENSVFSDLGRGNWQSCPSTTLDGLEWQRDPWEAYLLPASAKGKSDRVELGDPVVPGSTNVLCGTSADLPTLDDGSYDLVMTDPPFGNNLYYADLADFFYVWLRLPLLRLYDGLPERAYFEPERTPHAAEAITNPAEHPDHREPYEREAYVPGAHLDTVRTLASDPSLDAGDPNPLYLPEPAADFYRKTLTACWAEATRKMKPGGLLTFTFHHSEDDPWIDVLESLFDAGLYLAATYPIRSDETKGAGAAFGSRKIEYDIVHVCRKRLQAPEPVSWAQMRRWVKKEAATLRDLLEHTHQRELSEPDLRVVLRGKALEFYSRHYGQVLTGESKTLGVRDALLGINQLLDDLLTTGDERRQPPEAAEPLSRLYLRLFQTRKALPKGDLHKTLRGTGFSAADLEARGWVQGNATVEAVPVAERFAYFTTPGRTRKVLKTDLDKAHFLIGAALPGSGLSIPAELGKRAFDVPRGVDAILGWSAETGRTAEVKQAASTAQALLGQWRQGETRRRETERSPESQMSLFERLDAEAA